MTRKLSEIISDMRNIVKPYIAKQLKQLNFEHCGSTDKAEFETEFEMVLTLAEMANNQVTPQRWIPVSERLPKEEGDYLLWGKVQEDEEEYQFIGSYDSGCEQFGIWEEQFDRTTLGCLGSEFLEYASVIAWMPLPESYKAENGEKE